MEVIYWRRNQQWSCSGGGPPHDEAGATDCFFCRVNLSMKDKFITAKTNDRIDRRILHLQQNLGLRPGEPLSFANINRLIPPMISRYTTNRLNHANSGKPVPSHEERSKENDYHRQVQHLEVPVNSKNFDKQPKPSTLPKEHTSISAAAEPQKNCFSTSEKRTNVLHQRHSSNPHPANKGSEQTANGIFKGSNVAHQRHSLIPQATIIRSNKCATVIGDLPKISLPEKSTSSLITKDRSESLATVLEKRSTIPKNIPASSGALSKNHTKVSNLEHISASQPSNIGPQQCDHDKRANMHKFSSKDLAAISVPDLFSNPHLIKRGPKLSQVQHLEVPVNSKDFDKQSKPSTLPKKHTSISAAAEPQKNCVSTSEKRTNVLHQRLSSNPHPANKGSENTSNGTFKGSNVAHQRHSLNPQATIIRSNKCATVIGDLPKISLPEKSTSSVITKDRSESLATVLEKRPTIPKNIPASSGALSKNHTKVSNLEHISASQPSNIGPQQCRIDHDKRANMHKFSSKDLAAISVPELFSNPHLIKREPKLSSTIPNNRSTILTRGQTSSQQPTKSGHKFLATVHGKHATVPQIEFSRILKPLNIRLESSASSKGVKRKLHACAEYPATKKLVTNKHVT